MHCLTKLTLANIWSDNQRDYKLFMHNNEGSVCEFKPEAGDTETQNSATRLLDYLKTKKLSDVDQYKILSLCSQQGFDLIVGNQRFENLSLQMEEFPTVGYSIFINPDDGIVNFVMRRIHFSSTPSDNLEIPERLDPGCCYDDRCDLNIHTGKYSITRERWLDEKEALLALPQPDHQEKIQALMRAVDAKTLKFRHESTTMGYMIDERALDTKPSF